jgi:hypothetical protein
VNRAPYGGNGTVSPSQGVSLSTVFSLRAYKWQAEAGALPLSYSYSARDNAASREILLAASATDALQVCCSAVSTISIS